MTMQPTPYTSNPGHVLMCQPKHDGVRGTLSRLGVFSRGGVRLNNCSSLTALAHRIEVAAGEEVIIDGELVSGCFEDTVSLLLGETHRDDSTLVFHVFDIVPVSHWDVGFSMPYQTRDRWLNAVCAAVGSDHLKHVGHVLSKDIVEAGRVFVQQGHEGVVAKDPSSRYVHGYAGTWIKWKPAFDADCTIQGVVKDGEALRYLIVKHDGRVFNLRSGLKAADKRAILGLDSITGSVIEVTHDGYTKRGALRFPRFKRLRPDKH